MPIGFLSLCQIYTSKHKQTPGRLSTSSISHLLKTLYGTADTCTLLEMPFPEDISCIYCCLNLIHFYKSSVKYLINIYVNTCGCLFPTDHLCILWNCFPLALDSRTHYNGFCSFILDDVHGAFLHRLKLFWGFTVQEIIGRLCFSFWCVILSYHHVMSSMGGDEGQTILLLTGRRNKCLHQTLSASADENKCGWCGTASDDGGCDLNGFIWRFLFVLQIPCLQMTVIL